MSPASSGSLEVERYIGACLISQQNRSKNKQHQHQAFQRAARDQYVPDIYQQHFRLQRCQSDGWAGGLPLVSFANSQRRHGRRHDAEGDHHQLARLAVHTQGAPLILAKSYNHRKNKVHRNNPTKVFETAKKEQTGTSAGVDTVSVTSDESSGSANSENCLPRIIKPRKRRKKDRKPPLLGRPLSQDGFSTDSASPDIDNGPVNALGFNPFAPFSFYRVPEAAPQLIDRCHILGDISETPTLHHTFDDVEDVKDGKDINGNQPTSTCQCRYCDPSGQIWDVDRDCYSPFLTPPKSFRFPNLNPDVSYSSPISSSESHCLVRGMSTVSLEEDDAKKATPSRSSSSSSCRDLEVSTEIVTSLNGHRDLEIKFFTSAATAPEGARNSDKCAVDKECGFVCEE